MYPDYECNNYPMSITDDDGPFLVMEAELFYNDELKMSSRRAGRAITILAQVLLRQFITANRLQTMTTISGVKVGKRRSSSIR